MYRMDGLRTYPTAHDTGADVDVISSETVVFVLRFSIVAVPDVVDDAVTVNRTLSPALKLMPLKAYA